VPFDSPAPSVLILLRFAMQRAEMFTSRGTLHPQWQVY